MGGFDARAAAPDGQIVLKPFVDSPTVTTFAQGLLDHWYFGNEADFPPLRQMINAEFVRTGVSNLYHWEYRPAAGPVLNGSETDKIERRRAAFFTRLAVEYIAPRALRRAGLEQMAADVASGVVAPAAAQHAIGAANAVRCQAAGAPSPMPALESCAYGTSAHASTAAFYATLPEIDCVHQTGWFCAQALLHASFCDDVAVENPADIWNFAAATINAAIGLRDADAGEVLGRSRGKFAS